MCPGGIYQLLLNPAPTRGARLACIAMNTCEETRGAAGGGGGVAVG